MDEKVQNVADSNPIVNAGQSEPATTSNKPRKFNKSLVLVGILLVLTVVLLVVSLMAKKSSPVPTVSTSEQTGMTQTNLSISDQPTPSQILGLYDTNVNIDTGKNKVTGVQLSISYDPKVISNVDIKPGNFLKNPVILQKTIDPAAGTITFVVGTPQGSHGVMGKGQLGIISFTKAGAGDVDLNFQTDTIVTAEGYDKSVLNQMNSAVITNLPGGASSQAPTPSQ